MQKPVTLFLVLAMCLQCLAPAAHAARYRISPGTPPPTDVFPGDGQNLPVGCQTSEAQLIAHARSLQKVQAAMAEFERVGYTPRVTRGHVGCARPTLFSKVAFVYSRPNALAPDSSYGFVPIILVITTLSETTGEPNTLVTGGLMTLHEDRETIDMATDMVGPEEQPFEVMPTGSPHLANEKSRRPSTADSPFDIVRSSDPLIYQYFVCMGRNAFRNLLIGMGVGSGSASMWGKAKLQAIVAEIGGWEVVAIVMVTESVLECTFTMYVRRP